MTTQGRFHWIFVGALALLVLSLQSGCGLGTEIGNGKKPKSAGDDPDLAANDKNDDEDDDIVDGAETADPNNEQVDGADDQEVVDGVAGSASDATSLAAALGFDPSALVAECASPFSTIHGEKLVFHRTDGAKDQGTELTAAYANDEWTISGATPLFATKVDPANGEFAITARDAGTEKNIHPYTCGDVSVNPASLEGKSGSFTHMAVTLTGESESYTLSWYTDTDADDRHHLVRIDVEVPSTTEAPTHVILDVVP
jgi:hypothetical protein